MKRFDASGWTDIHDWFLGDSLRQENEVTMSHLKVKCRSVRAKCEKSGLEDRGVFFSPEICLHFVELYKMVEGPNVEMLKAST